MRNIYLLLAYVLFASLYSPKLTVTGASAPAIDAAKTTRQASIDKSVKTGTDFSFKCFATGDPTPSYKWTKDGQSIDAASDTRLSLSGGTFTIKSLNYAKDDGVYQCTANNTNGKDVSAAIDFKVAVVGSFQSPCSQSDAAISINATIGRPLLMDCPTVTYTYPKFYFWAFDKGQKQAEALPLDQRTSRLSNGSLYFSYIKDDDIVTINSKGGIHCMISSDGTEIQSCPFTLNKIQGTVQTFGPTFIQQISGSVTVIENSKYTLDCTAGGNPTPKMAWYRNDKLITNENGIKMTIDAIKRTDAGIYKCGATSNGKTINASATLIVEYKPAWKVQLKDEREYVGTAITLSCDADGLPVPKYEWFKSGTKLTSANLQPSVTIDGGKLTIVKLSEDHAGTYQCAAVNKYRTIYTTSTITVLKIPTTTPATSPTTLPTTKGPTTSTPTKAPSTSLRTTNKKMLPTTTTDPKTNAIVKSTLIAARRNPTAGCSDISYCLGLILLIVFVTIRISL